MPQTCPPDEKLASLIDGLIDETDAAQLDSHLEQCASCQERLDALTSPQLIAAAEAEPIVVQSLIHRLQHMHAEIVNDRDTHERAATETSSTLRDRQVKPLPEKIGHYRVLEEVGAGATGRLYCAVDERLDRVVALKILRESLVGNDSAQERLQREARSAAALSHDHIVTLHEFVASSESAPYLVMEFVDGESLQERIHRQTTFPAEEAARIASTIASALHAAHDAGVIHRDVKSSNILLDSVSGRAKITDFGLARITENDSHLTHEGMIAGTPAYMSPEQIADPTSVDPRSDVYSLGIVLYQMLTGTLPFRGTTRMTLLQVQYDDPQSPRKLNDRVPADLETICMKAVAKDPAARYASAAELEEDLQRYMEDRPIQARPTGWSGRAFRWCRRNPRVAALWSSVAIVFILATALSMATAVTLAAANNEVREAESRARKSATSAANGRDAALKTLRRLVTDVPKALEYVPADTSDVEELISKIAIEGLDEIAATTAPDDQLNLNTAMGYYQLGATLLRVDRLDEAESRLRKAMKIADALPPSDNVDSLQIQIHLYLSNAISDFEVNDEQKKLIDQAMSICDAWLKRSPKSFDARLAKARCMNYQTDVALSTDELEKAGAQLKQAKELLAALVKEKPDSDDVAFEVEMHEMSQDDWRAAVRHDSPDEAIMFGNEDIFSDEESEKLGSLYAAYEEAVEDDGPMAFQNQAKALVNLGEAYRCHEFWKDARSFFNEARELLDGEPASEQVTQLSRAARVGIALTLAGQGKTGKALPQLRALLVEVQQLVSPSVPARKQEVEIIVNLAMIYGEQTDNQQAKQTLQQAKQRLQQLASDTTATNSEGWKEWHAAVDKQIQEL